MTQTPRRRTVFLTVLTMLAALLTGLFSAEAAHADTAITLDGTQGGRTFDGIGAISGGGGNSRSLIDYPDPERSQILDYLFKPGYGAALQILKVEIGGDTNSTDGSESSIEHTRGSVNCSTGYEWWLMQQAKARNPAIKLYGLAWGAPGWIGGGNFWSQDTVDYLMAWESCAASHGLTIDYLGGWNERGYNQSWYENLHATIAAHGYPTKVVGADSGWDVADAMVTDSSFDNSIDVVGAHYPCSYESAMTTCSTTSNALATGKQLWASENGSEDFQNGGAPMARAINRGYIDAKMTAYINWPLAAAVYPNLPYDTTGLVVANQPWSGAYMVGRSTWAAAHTTQFTAPGWKYIDSASGYFGGNRANGSYVTLHDPGSANWSVVAETLDATAAQNATFTVKGGLSGGTVHVWASDFSSDNQGSYMVHTADATPSNGTFSLTLQPGYVYTLTTTTGQGRGGAAGPAETTLALPYSDGFDGYATGTEARYLADQNGSWETVACGGGRSGQCERQMAAQAPITWDTISNPYTVLGDLSWSDYTVSSDVLLESAGAAQLLGRVGEQRGFNVSGIDEYYLQAGSTGAWSIVKNDTGGTLTTLASGSVAALGTGSWHRLALAFAGARITASIDGVTVGSVSDSSYGSGQVGLGLGGWLNAQYDNLSVIPGTATTLSGTYELVNRNSGQALDVSGGSTANGGLVIQWPYHGGTNQQWQVVAASGGYYKLLNANSGLALDVPNLATDPGIALDQWADNGGVNQQWLLAPAGGGYYTLTSRLDGLLADVSGASTTQGATVLQWNMNGGANQQWQLIKLS